MNGIRALLDDAADTPQHGIDVDELQRRARRRHRRTGVVAGTLVGALAVLALVVGGAVVSSADDAATVRTPAAQSAYGDTTLPDGWHRVESQTGDISIAVPPEWRQLPNHRYPGLEGDLALNVLAVGTTTRPRPDAWCPDAAAPPGVWLSIDEYVGSPGGEHQFVGMPLQAFPDRPVDFRDVEGVIARCDDAADGTLVFRDQGRHFWAQITVVGDPDGVGLRLGREILNTLRVEPLISQDPVSTVPSTTTPPIASPPTAAPTAPLTTEPVADVESATTAVLGWLNSGSPDGGREYIEDYDALADALREGQAQHTPDALAAFSGRVESATVIDADRVEVRYTLLQYGTPLYPDVVGTVVRIDGTWKVSRETVCDLLARGAVTCPPRGG